MSTPPKRIRTWHAVAAMFLVGLAVALFLRFQDPGSPSRFDDPQRNSIYESGLDACIGRAQAEVAGAQPPVSKEAIAAYCECAMGDVVEQLTDADIEQFNETEALSNEAMATMNTIAASCSQQFLPQ